MADLKLYSASDEKLTYYVTETRITDEATGSTEETLKKYTVYPSDGGLIVGNRNGRFITMSGGTVNLNGGYLTGNGGPGGGAIMTSRASSYAAGGKIYMTGENNSNGNITFDGRISFMSAGVFIYYAYETENTEDGGSKIVTDGARYKIEVEVEKISSTITVDDKNYTKEVFQFKRVTVYDAATGTQIKNYRTSDGTLSNNENHAVSLDPTGGRAFKNYNVTYITPSVKKVWVGVGTTPVYVFAAVLLTASAALFRFTFRRRKDQGTIV